MSKKVTVLGAGNVGSTIAYTMAVNGTASEIVMIDINNEKALGEAMDIRQGIPFCSPARVYAGDYPDSAGSDIVILTSGIARKPGQTRLDLTRENVNIVKSIIPPITKYARDAVFVIVSNPVDIITYLFNKISGIPSERIIGSGTILDTARLRSIISEHYNISQRNVHAYVFGEHGETAFVPWSFSNISGVPIDNYNESSLPPRETPGLMYNEIEDYIKKSGAEIIGRKGATYYAVSMSVCHICKCLFNNIETALTVSTMMKGQYGIDDVCLSTLTNIGKGGIRGRIMTPLNEKEKQQLQFSALALKQVISSLEI